MGKENEHQFRAIRSLAEYFGVEEANERGFLKTMEVKGFPVHLHVKVTCSANFCFVEILYPFLISRKIQPAVSLMCSAYRRVSNNQNLHIKMLARGRLLSVMYTIPVSAAATPEHQRIDDCFAEALDLLNWFCMSVSWLEWICSSPGMQDEMETEVERLCEQIRMTWSSV